MAISQPALNSASRKLRRALPAIILFLCILYVLRQLDVLHSFNTDQSAAYDAQKVLSLANSCPNPVLGDFDERDGREQGKRVPATPGAKHVYDPDGLLHVNPDAEHPIYELIREAEKEWERKMKSASTTLEEAVVEYKRRYKRPPPKGFDLWWDYAQSVNVQLPDEYDFIFRDLEPFWGISPKDLNDIQKAQESVTDTFVLAKNSSLPVDVATYAFKRPDQIKQSALLRGVDEMQGLLKPVEHLLPHFRLIISPHDNPNLLFDYEIKKKFVDAARAGTYVDLSTLHKPKHIGFAAACPIDSPARPIENATKPIDQFSRPPPRTEKTFIHEHRLSMDPCTHPEIFYNHAQYVAHDLGPEPQPLLAMQFSYCSTPVFHDIQPPTFIAWHKGVSDEVDPPWEEKTDERLMWRGSNTGMNSNDGTRWTHAHRIRLVHLASEINGTVKVLMETGEGVKVGEGTEMRKAIVNPALMDIAFTGHAIGCEPDYCEYMETIYEWRRKQDPHSKEPGNHKYFVDVDGNGWSSRFKRLITTRSLVFKATAYPEWWLDRVQPWVHYVPVQVDYSDLYDAYIFFRGGLYGENNHDDLARKIALEGRKWSQEFWRREDMTAYFFRLILEYARLMSLDRDSMNYEG